MTSKSSLQEGSLSFPCERISRFLKLLQEGQQAFLFDGGVATQLYEKGIFINRSFDEVNLSQAELISQIHKQYIQAGTQVITTNTWGANRLKLQNYGLDSQLFEINLRGAQIARESAGDVVWVAGCLGPLGVRIEPWGPTSFDEAKEFFFEQAKALQQGGVDLFVLEGFADLNEIHQAIRAVKSLGDYPVIAMMTTNDDGQTLFGTEPEWFVRKLDEWGADAVGVNGGNGPAPLLELAKRLKSATSKPLILKPNAGLPRQVDGRLIYMASPEYMGEFARQALLQGVRILGGCSGTTPQHIRAMSGAIRQGAALRGGEAVANLQVTVASEFNSQPSGTEPSSRWSRGIADGKFVVSIELLPPKGLDIEKLLERSAQCKTAGIDAINIPDGPRASARMSALAAACLIEQKVGIETVLHYACRDRNILGIQSDLIGAAGLGLRNILCVTGDPPKLGPYPTATAVFDIDAIGLVNMATRLNSGYDLGGTSIGRATGFSIGVGANPMAPDLRKEFDRFRYKVEAGAHWAITQPVFDAESLLRFLDFSSQFKVPIIAGIWPLMSLRNAEFMANEVPGVYVPPALIERMRARNTTEDQRKEGLQIAHELIAQIKPHVQGLQISAPLGQVELALALI
ncbi:bifunctional homocysteine S-methyltransferase/methylenetetrahydrofolate reductase [bacterium]|nr:bifunctional homocysteine S-methyltransferase/methylenetetrahydrofolate reductase [bacterium]